MAGTRASIQIADNVHVVAVTASVPSSALQPGQIYSYNLHFLAGSGEAPPSAPNLTSAGVLRSAAGIGPQSLAYPGQTLPTFALPPADLNDLRLIHGSCRKPHATGRDALQALDGMIQSTASSATERPHQLYLTGDQIYADDVADALLHMLNDAASALGFADEGLVLARPGQRAQQVKAAGITADDAACKSQLVTFSEYCTMYLFAWSDVLWQGEDFPGYEEATGLDPDPDPGAEGAGNLPVGASAVFDREIELLRQFRQSIAAVRRALANIPTYMIFDDHEVTDDWFLDRAWVNASANNFLLGRLVLNGVAAYALFQGWGNVPTRFEQARSGVVLLNALSNYAQSPDGTNGETLRNALGLPTGPVSIGQESYPRDESAIDWHYGVSGPSYQVLALDSRTRRGYPTSGPHGHPALIESNALNQQLATLQAPSPEEVTIVIAPGPVAGLGLLEMIQLASASPYPHDTEFWNARPIALERLLARLATRGNPIGGVRSGRVVLLSGDVHYGFAGELRYRATAPLELSGTTEAAFAQLTCSSLRNQDDKTLQLHHSRFTVRGLFLQNVVRYGWNNSAGEEIHVGALTVTPPQQPIPVTTDVKIRSTPLIFEEPNHILLLLGNGTFLRNFPSSQTPAPDWIYRIQYISSNDNRNPDDHPPIVQVPFPPAGDRQAALQAHLASFRNHDAYHEFLASGKEIVGQNNIGELTFEWGAAENKWVIQELWWWLSASSVPFPLTRYRCSLALHPETL